MPDILNKHAYKLLATATVFMIVFGTVFYHIVEKFPWLDSYYFCVVTLATVGYGDYVPHTDLGKLFTTVYIFVGIGILTAFITQFGKRQAERIAERREHNGKPSIKDN